MVSRGSVRSAGRGAVRRAAGAELPPAARIPARRSSHGRDSAVLAATGLGAWGASPLLGWSGAAGTTLAVAGVGGAGVWAVRGQLRVRRRELEDRLVEALAPLLGVRALDRRIVRLDRWSRGWPGTPRRVRIHYAPGAPDSDPGWLGEVTGVLSARLLARYVVAGHDRRRCRLRLRLAPPARKEAADPAIQQRAERLITELVGVTARVTGVEFDGDQLRAVTVSHQAGARLAASGYRTRIERVISATMPGRWRALWDMEGDSVRFEVRPSLPASVWLPAPPMPASEDLLTNYRQVAIPCAVDEDGREVQWRPATVPMVMLTGSTGSGKTSAAHALLGQITRYGWPVWVLDAKRVEFLDLRTWPNVQIVAGSIVQQVALVQAAWELMEHRYELIEAGRAAVTDFEPLVVFLDEFAEFRSNLLEWYAQIKVKGDPTRPPTLAQVASLARKARTARIHLVLSTQRPDVELLGQGEMRDNFGFRISMGRLSPQGAMMMWENPAVGVSLPRGCVGRAIATHDDGRPVEVQCYRFPSPDADPGTPEHALLEAIRPTETRWPRLVIVPPDTDVDDSGDPKPATFREYAAARWDLASNHPELDPVAAQDRDPAVGRSLSSTMASLGLAGRPASSHPAARPAPVEGLDVAQLEPGVDALAGGEEYVGYAPAVRAPVADLLVGDLIEADEGSGVWVVVDEPVEEDPAAPGHVAVSWRGDGDEAGFLSIPEDEWIGIRHPEEVEDL